MSRASLQQGMELSFGEARQVMRAPRKAAPSSSRSDPIAHRCACGAYACFGWSPPLVQIEQWFCPACKPADFYTRGRA